MLRGPTTDTTFSAPSANATQTVAMDPGSAALIADDLAHHVAIIADAGPLIAMFLVDGQFCDGGGVANSGWAFLRPFRALGGTTLARIAPSYGGELRAGHLYTRSLRVSEAMASYRAHRSL